MYGVNKYTYLLRTILLGDKKQALLILKTINEKQVQLISEIFHNLVLIPQSKEVDKVLKKNKKLVFKIANAKLSTRKRVRLTSKYNKLLLKILYMVKKQLLELVNDG